MSHLPILPIILPLACGAILLLCSSASLVLLRAINILAVVLLLVVVMLLGQQVAAQSAIIYVLSDWQPPFGIILVADRLSVLMLAVTAVLALPAAIAMSKGLDRESQNFHALFQFQLLGINGAFLTGDLFNLFVFFEILLISSYALLVFGGGKERVAAGLHYVVLNLVGSALFLVAVGTLYGVTGALNMADLAVQINQAEEVNLALLAAAGLLFMVVFGLKAAVLPVGLWLPAAYSSTSAPVAALFAIMTKVGVYAIIRVHGTLFGDQAGSLAGLGTQLLWVLGLLTMILGMLGALAAGGLRKLLAWLVLVSVGVMLAGFAMATRHDNPQMLAAVLYYLVHSTWVLAAFFLLAGYISERRGTVTDSFAPGPYPGVPAGIMFLLLAVATVGLPPLSGFIGKLLLLNAAGTTASVAIFWVLVLLSGLVSLLAFARAGSTLFWRYTDAPASAASTASLWPIGVLFLASPLLALFGESLFAYLLATAEAVMDPTIYIDAVLGSSVVSELRVQ